jgi:hypothetical protein
LTNVTIGSGVASIGFQPFAASSSLLSITVDVNNPFFSSIDGVLFNRSHMLLINFPEGRAGNYTILSSVTNIGVLAFFNCTGLTGITIPPSVVCISTNAFCYCIGLTGITIPKSVTSIEDTAFNSCSGLTNVIIPNSVTNLGGGAFIYCTSLSSIIIPDGITSIEDGLFYDCTSLTNVVMPKSVSNIGFQSFGSCASLSSITISAHVTNIGYLAFANCYNLTGVYFNGNAPATLDPPIFDGSPLVIIYYVPGTTGWGTTFAGCPTVPWLPAILTNDGGFGVMTNQFGFSINWASGQTVVVEASMSLLNPDWQPVQTNTLATGTDYFSDPQWTNYPARFYRIRSQ